MNRNSKRKKKEIRKAFAQQRKAGGPIVSRQVAAVADGRVRCSIGDHKPRKRQFAGFGN